MTKDKENLGDEILKSRENTGSAIPLLSASVPFFFLQAPMNIPKDTNGGIA